MGIPTVLHGSGTCPAPRRNISRPGRLGGRIEFLVATYLIVQSPGTALSISKGWYDANYCWWPEFDVDYGRPLGPPVRTSSHSWFRLYSRSTVKVNVSLRRIGTVHLLP